MYTAYQTIYCMEWQTRSSIRMRLIKLTWKKKNKHSGQCYLQQAVKVWNEQKVGEKVLKEDKDFKDWCEKEIKHLYGNINLE